MAVPEPPHASGDENASNSGRCVVIFQRGHVRWMEVERLKQYGDRSKVGTTKRSACK